MDIKNETTTHFEYKAFFRLALLILIAISFVTILIFSITRIDYLSLNILGVKPHVTPNTYQINQPTQFSITNPFKGEIHFTTDASQPTISSPQLDEDTTINIDQTTLIRYAVFRENEKWSPTYSHLILFQTNHTLPVIAINTEPENLWSAEKGIYTDVNKNYDKQGSDWERPAEFLWLQPDGKPEFDKSIGLRINGGGSRSLPQKSFRIYFTNDGQRSTLNYPVFPELEYQIFSSLILRNAGGDGIYAFMRDALIHHIADQATDLDTQASRPVVLYLNGQYWGIYYLRERPDEEMLSHKYMIDPDRIGIVEVPHDFGDDRGKVTAYTDNAKEDVKQYNSALEDFRKCDGCFDYVAFEQKFNVQNFIDYLIFEIHFANFDWPYGNFKAWRYQTPFYLPNEGAGLDGRFRFFLQDLDVGFGFGSDSEEAMISASKSGSYGRLIDNYFPFRSAFFDDRFVSEFLLRYADLLNTAFTPENMRSQIDQFAAELEPEMPNQIERWGGQIDPFDNVMPSEVDQWHESVELLRVYADHRADDMFENSKEQFEIENIYTLTLDVNRQDAGHIKLNTIGTLEQPMPFEGRYFENLNLTITAVPESGYKFSHWVGLPTVYERQAQNEKLQLPIKENLHLQAEFVSTK